MEPANYLKYLKFLACQLVMHLQSGELGDLKNAGSSRAPPSLDRPAQTGEE